MHKSVELARRSLYVRIYDKNVNKGLAYQRQSLQAKDLQRSGLIWKSCTILSQDQKPPHFPDDPGFEAGIEELDQGLGGPAPVNEEALPPPKSVPVAPIRRIPAEPLATSGEIFPESTLAPKTPAPPPSRIARGANPAAIPEWADGATPAAGSPRPLVTLFPPPFGRDRTHPPASSVRPERQVEERGPVPPGAPPPRIVRKRFAQQADSAELPQSPTYAPFYGLTENPFSLSPAAKFTYHSASYDRALQELIDALGRRDAVMLLTGEPGVGKTTLCHSLVAQLGGRCVTSLIAEPVASFEDLLRTVLVDFGVVARANATRGRMAGVTRQELIAAVGDFTASLAPRQASALIIIDQAQEAGPEILEPLSVLSRPDVRRSGPQNDADRRVQILLVGQPMLPVLLHRQELRALERQVAVRCRLDPLTAEEVIGYLTHRLSVAGASVRVKFDEGACAELHAATRGVPRLVNLVCDGALTRGQQTSAGVITDELVAASAADLELVPRRSDARRIVHLAVRGIVLLALTLAGAAAAAWVFRAQVAQLLNR